jgi:hypothetical protein
LNEHATTIIVSQSTKFGTTVATTITSLDEGDNGHIKDTVNVQQ